MVAELIDSGLVQRLVPYLALRDLQSLGNISTVLREWLDSVAQPGWQQIRARLVPASHYLASVVTGLSTATIGHARTVNSVYEQLTAADRPSPGSLPVCRNPESYCYSTVWYQVSSSLMLLALAVLSCRSI